VDILNICIDIDGTITEPYFWLDSTNKYFNKNIREEQVTAYDIHQVMGVERHEYERFYENNKFEIHSDQKIREDVQSVLRILSATHNIYFVTAREQELKILTHVYLRKNRISYDSLHVLGSHYKVDKAKELKCSIFIEDSYDNAMQLSSAGFKVLLLDTNYNRKPLNEDVIRVYDWKEIFVKINELSLKTGWVQAQ